MAEEKVNILIVEDESIVALDLAMGLEHDGYRIAGIADNAADALRLFQEQNVDLVLMDINIIGDKDGIDTAQELLRLKQVPIIYLTAFTDPQTVERVKKTHPAAFLTKPYNISNVRIAIEIGIHNFALARETSLVDPTTKIIPLYGPTATARDQETLVQMQDHIFIKDNYQFVKVRLEDILYAEADNNYVHLVTQHRKFALRLSLNLLVDRIRYDNMIRIHRSFYVNMAAIESFTQHEVNIREYALPIGRNYKDDFLRRFEFL